MSRPDLEHLDLVHLDLVLFDLDDTLFAHRDAVRVGIVRHVESLGPAYGGLDRAAADALWHELEERHYHRYLAGELSFEGQRRARAFDFAAAHGVHLGDDESGGWFDAYFERYVEAWTLHDDALPALDALEAARPGIRLGIITNGDPAFQARKLRAVGLDERMHDVVASGGVGVTKPDPRIFHLACERFGVAPDRAAYVGDRLGTDAVGAAEAGLTGVWLDRPGTAAHGTPLPALAPGAGPLLRIESLAALPAALAALAADAGGA